MRADEVPDDGLMVRAVDGDDAFTLRRPEKGWPSGKLEEEISAAILRCAKEKFWGRDLEGEAGQAVMESVETVDDSDVSSGAARSKAGSTADEEGDESGGIKEDEREVDGEQSGTKTKRLRSRSRRSESESTAVPIADDEYSYTMLRPASRRILSRLDETLTILHNARVAGLQNMSASSTDDEETEAEVGPRKIGRPRKASPPRQQRHTNTKRGRPRKVHLPREGETHREMMIRVARQSKKRLPTFYEDGAQTEEEVPRRRGKKKDRSLSGSRPSSFSPKHGPEEIISRWSLRDWRDVMAAAAMAGFPPSVIERATQRCSTFFDQEMILHTLPEQPADSEAPSIHTSTFNPGAPLMSSSGEDDAAEDELVQLRAVSRQSSVRFTSQSPEGGPATSRRRRRSATPGGERHFCPHASCSRALEGFARRSNLIRHLELVHGKRNLRYTAAEEEDSMEEMEGAIHRDRFLQPIKVRKGWRAEDVGRSRVRRKAKRHRSRASGSDDGGVDSDGLGLKQELSSSE